MSQDALKARVAAALTKVVNPRAGTDVIAAGSVTELEVGPDGRVRLAIALRREDPAALVREVRQVVEAVAGVTSVKLEVRNPEREEGPTHAPPQRAGGMAEMHQTTPKSVPPPAPRQFPHLGRIVAVSSGKGGVGKSTVAVNLAAALAAAGQRVGVMDADVYGPNVPRMLGLMDEKPAVVERRLLPLEAHGVKFISLGNLVERDTAAIWRGPIIMKIIQQFLGDVEWGQLDFFIVDMPPGTGDAQLSLVQSVHVDGAVIVTTPQDVAVGDALRGAKMFERVGVPVLGIVENMSFFECPHCGERTDVFASGGGRRLAAELDIPLLAEVPLQARIQQLGETGVPVVLADPGSPAAKALSGLAEALVEKIGSRSIRLPIIAG